MSDLSTEVLIEIRNELRSTNQRLDRTNERLDASVQEQIRQRTAIVDLQAGLKETNDTLAGMAREMSGMARDIRGLNSRIDNVLVGPVGSTVKEVETRLRRVEEHLGLAGPSK